MPKTRLNGEGSIRLRNDGRYEVRVSGGMNYLTGQHVRISKYAKTEEEAVRLLHQLSLQVGNSRSLQRQNITLGDWLDLWLEVYMKHHLKQSTCASYETYARKHFKPALGCVLLIDINSRMLQQFYNYKIKVEGLSAKTISNMNLYLHKALSQAVKEGLIESNPASALELPKSSRPKIQVLTRDEQACLMRASYQHRYGVFIRLVLMTGLRLGELLGLWWSDIDFRSNMLHVNRTLNRVQKIGLPDQYSGLRTELLYQEPKTENSRRSIPLLPGVVQDLLRWRSIQDADRIAAGEQYIETGSIVTNECGGCIEPRTFSDYYHQILEIAGIGHFTFHALRHTFATRAMEQGMDSKTLSILLGHFSVAFTQDTYTHVLDAHKWDGINLMEGLFDLDQSVPVQQAYPVIFTPCSDGYLVNFPDFPQIRFTAPDMESGLETAMLSLSDTLSVTPIPPIATDLNSIVTAPGQFKLQIAI